MAYCSTPQTSTAFTPNNNFYCNYVEDLRNSMIDAYFRTRTCLGEAANRQKIYYNRDTKPRHLKKGDWVINWHKYTVKQTLSNGWIGPFVVTFKSGTC